MDTKRKANKGNSQRDLLITSLPREWEEAHHIFIFPMSMPPSCLQTSTVVTKQSMTLFKDIMYLTFFLFWLFRKSDLPAVYFHSSLVQENSDTHRVVY